jgi:hypothetical protein
MRFSEQFSIERPANADWFDLNVEQDTPLYVDPFLIFDDGDDQWVGAHDDVVGFFEAALTMLKLAEGHESSLHWKKAERFLQCPEPKEFALGLSMGHPEGSGIGPDLAREICRGLDLFRVWQRDADDKLLGMVSILVPGLGVDRISDMVCNILKSRFIIYTQGICDDLGVAVECLQIHHSSWVAATCRWQDAPKVLPRSPAFNGAVLLTPQRFLKDIPRVTPEGFWSWATVNENDLLRFELNYDLAQSLTAREKAILGRDLARKAPVTLRRYVGEAVEDPAPYDVDVDPKGLVRWVEAGRSIAEATTAPKPPKHQGEFEEWLIALATTFKSAVEDEGLWRVLWNEKYTAHRQEKITQAACRHGWVPHCQASNIDISREVETGRGPVDFKFTQGWTMRGLIEVKHIDNYQFFHGADTQLPIYLRGERVSFGVYLCVGYSDKDFEDDRLQVVLDTCESIAQQGNLRIVPIFVDARPKKSASTA